MSEYRAHAALFMDAIEKVRPFFLDYVRKRLKEGMTFETWRETILHHDGLQQACIELVRRGEDPTKALKALYEESRRRARRRANGSA